MRTYIKHKNEWYWGISITVIADDGKSSIDLAFDKDRPNTVFLRNLTVSEEVRRRGRAKEILDICESIILDYKVKYMMLDVNKNIDWLVEWYNKMGFTIIFIDDNEYRMVKNV